MTSLQKLTTTEHAYLKKNGWRYIQGCWDNPILDVREGQVYALKVQKIEDLKKIIPSEWNNIDEDDVEYIVYNMDPEASSTDRVAYIKQALGHVEVAISKKNARELEATFRHYGF